jgi:putative membrane protein
LKRNFWWRVVVNAAGLYLIARYLVHGVQYTGPLALIAAGFVLGLVNAVIRPLFVILALPFNLLTLGLFTFIVNGFMVKITSWLVAILISLFSALVNGLLGEQHHRW